MEEKIFDVENYDPTTIKLEQVRDDWRIICAWYTTKKKGKKLKYTFKQIIDLATKIVEYLKTKDTEFHPETMKPYSRELFEIVSKELGWKTSIDEKTERLLKLNFEIADACKTPVVTGDGNLAPTLMIIGYEPSEEDLNSGIPFSGKFKDILFKMLDLARITPDHVYCTFYKKTILKIPVEGKEVDWHKCLIEEINILQPSLILTLGLKTFQKLIPMDDQIDSLRMKAYPLENSILVVTYAPEDFVENLEEQREVFEDMIYLRKIIRLASSMKEKGYLEEMDLKELAFPEFVWIPKFISLSGGIVYAKDRKPNDIDIVPRVLVTPEQDRMYLNLDDALDIKIRRILEARFPNLRINWVPCLYGPNWKFLPVYDLVLRPRKPLKLEEIKEPEFEREFYKAEREAINPEMTRQARQSLKEDKIKMFRFFWPFKTALSAVEAYRKGAKYQVEGVVEYIEKLSKKRKVDFVPFFAQKKYDGNRVIVFKSKDKVKIVSDSGTDITHRLPDTEKELLSIKHPEEFILDAELEIWEDKTHLPREDIAGYLHGKDEPDDSNVIVNCFDCLYFSDSTMKHHELNLQLGDIHKKSQEERLQYLELIPFKQSTIDYPNQKYQLNHSPSFYVKEYEEIEKVLNEIANSPASEGAMIKWAEDPFPLEGSGIQWLKYKKLAEIHTIVWKKVETKTKGVWNYQVALLFTGQDKIDPKSKVKVKGREFTNIGRLYNSAVDVPVGGIVAAKFHTLNLYKSPDGAFRLHLYEPKLYEYRKDQTEPDSVRTAIKIAKDAGLLETKYLEKIRIEMAQDPFLYYPPEEKSYKYVMQHHWRGKSCHIDFRCEVNDYLIGWTLMDLIAGKVKEPVHTLTEAREQEKKKPFKIDFTTGKFLQREIKGGIVRPANIRSSQKAKEPKSWLDVQGIAAIGTPGSTASHPGVFLIIDKGKIEFGAQKPYSHEYFLSEGKIKGKLLFRMLGQSEKALEEELKEAWREIIEEGEYSPEEEAQQFKRFVENVETYLEEGIEIHTEEEYEDRIRLEKVILPPGKAPEGVPLSGLFWICMQPIKQTPYVLGTDAIKKAWLPPVGWSCLPKKIRDKVPERLKYWKEANSTKALEMRKELSEFEELGVEVKEKAKGDKFVLQRHWWKGPVVIRFGPSTEHWDIRIDTGKPQLIHFVCLEDPLENEALTCYLKPCKDKSTMEFPEKTTELKPGTSLNPTKNTPAYIEKLDGGKCIVFEDTKQFKKVEFKGKKLKGLWIFKPEAEDSKIWVMNRSKLPETKKNFGFG